MFLGEECPFEKSQIIILPIAFDQTTTYGKGTDKGPAAIIEASKHIELYDIETESEVYQSGIHTANTIYPQSSEEMLNDVYEKVDALLMQGKYVVSLGGEHSISYPLIRSHANRYGPITVLQLDAHSDLDPALEGNPFSHGSVMAQVKTIPEVDHVIGVGVRSMGKKEVKEMDKESIFFAHELEGEDWMDQLIEKLSDRVYLSFDLDVFDSSLMPSTGTPEPGGLFWNQTMKLLKKVIRKRSLIGFDVVELCPLPNLTAPDYLAAKLIYKILSYLFEPKERKHVNC